MPIWPGVILPNKRNVHGEFILMKKIFLILPLLIIGTANAASMCVPKVAESQSYSYLPSIEETNNRGYFAMGTSCVSGTTMCRDTLIRGESHCSAASILPADNFETYGKYCYCRLTHARAPNGYLANRSGGWVFRSAYSWEGRCTEYCAVNCANYFRTWTAMRRAMLATPAL